MWQRPPDRKNVEGIAQPDLAIREGNFKMLINTDGSGVELYDIANNEEESTNIAGKHREVVKALSEKLFKWYADLPDVK
jgi:uncharacterized sulfatase